MPKSKQERLAYIHKQRNECTDPEGKAHHDLMILAVGNIRYESEFNSLINTRFVDGKRVYEPSDVLLGMAISFAGRTEWLKKNFFN